MRRWLYLNLEPKAWTKTGLSPLNRLIAVLICAAILSAILDSEPALPEIWHQVFFWLDAAIFVVFLVEYVVRIWVAGEDPAYAGVSGRLRYMLSVPALLDLMALMPLLSPWIGSEGVVLRLFRLARIVRLARLGRYSEAFTAISRAVMSRRYELLMSFFAAAFVLLLTSTLLYVVEGEMQPETFGSIPRAMWWAIATLTTVGYGDVTPVTPLGRVFAGISAITGIGLIAMPTGILAAAFSDAVQNRRNEQA